VPRILLNLPAELGDFEVKIKDVLKEGFWSGFASKIQPQALQSKEEYPVRGTGKPLDSEVAKKAQELYGIETGKKPTPAEKEQAADSIPKPKPETTPEIELPTRTSNNKPAPAKPTPDPAATPEPAPAEPEHEQPINLADEPLARDERIAVETPAGMMYKYPNERWYQIPSTGIPIPVPSNQYEILDDYANIEGYVEKIPPTKRKKR
jgi:outer membrane biosynthesis protein TonB